MCQLLLFNGIRWNMEWVQMNGITPSGVPGAGTAALHGCRLQSPATRCSAMVSNVTTLVCDIVPLWSGYIWLAQVGSSTMTC